MDYLSVLEHVSQLLEACFPAQSRGAAASAQEPIKVMYLCSAEAMLRLSPEDLRAPRGGPGSCNFGCLTVCRPQETDRLLQQMGSRWRNVAYVVEDAA